MSLPPERNEIVYIENKEGSLSITSFNLQTQRMQEFEIPFDIFQMLHLIRSSMNLNEIKAIAFILNENMFFTFTAAYNFRQKCFEFCAENGIFYLFISPNIIQSSMALWLSNTSNDGYTKDGEEILVLSYTPRGTLYGTRMIRTQFRYRIIYELHFRHPDATLKTSILGKSKPKKIILVRPIPDAPEFMEFFQNFFQSENPIILSPDSAAWRTTIFDTVLFFMNEKSSRNIVALPCIHTFHVCVGNVPLFQNLLFQNLPFEKSAIIEVVDPMKYVSLIAKPSSTTSFDELIKDVRLSTFNCKKVKVSLKVDINAFYDFMIEPVKEETLEQKVSNLYFVDFGTCDQPSKKARIRFSQDDYYIVLDNAINVAEKVPIYISFAEKKPIIGFAAKEICNTKPEFVVYDIIKLCLNSSLIFVNPKWKFSLSKSNESLMVTVKTFDGERQASPDLLLTMVIKDAIIKIQKEINTTLDGIEIGFDGFIPNKFLKQNFEKAADRLKVAISFY